ncbi:MAG: hypothetical protein VCB82_09185, partial [Alphaproteobacteria bacterium]
NRCNHAVEDPLVRYCGLYRLGALRIRRPVAEDGVWAEFCSNGRALERLEKTVHNNQAAFSIVLFLLKTQHRCHVQSLYLVIRRISCLFLVSI